MGHTEGEMGDGKGGRTELLPAQQAALVTAVLQQQATATRAARRLYVGNIPEGISPEVLQGLVNEAMSSAKLTAADGDCVNLVTIAPTGKYAFIEYRSAIEATSGLVLDGTLLQGHTLRFKRSNEYEDPIPTELERLMVPAGLPQQVRLAWRTGTSVACTTCYARELLVY
jgi:hypothetical protein